MLSNLFGAFIATTLGSGVIAPLGEVILPADHFLREGPGFRTPELARQSASTFWGSRLPRLGR